VQRCVSHHSQKARVSSAKWKYKRLVNYHMYVYMLKVIGIIRQKFSILHATLPISIVASSDGGVSFIDKIVTVGCALCNCCDSVVLFD